jgi:hypothetical protein
MASNTYTVDDLISNIKLTGHVPTGNLTFSDSNLAVLADRELKTPIMKQILSTRGNYYLTKVTLDEVASGLYDIPSDCVMGALYNVELVQGQTVIQVNPIELSEQSSTNTPNITTYGYFFEGNQLQILPTPPVGNLRLRYYKRTSKLVLNSACCLINAVDDTGTIVTVDSIPSNISIGSYVDIVGDQPPFNIIGTQTITNIVGMNITMDITPAVPADIGPPAVAAVAAIPVVSVGNFVALNQQTCVPQIPVEYRILLEQRVICSIYEIQKNKDGIKLARDKLAELESDTLGLMTNRVKSKVDVINVSIGGFLSGRGRRWPNYQAGRE